MTSRNWKEIAIAFDTPPGERTRRQKTLAICGLCYAYSKFRRADDKKQVALVHAIGAFCGTGAWSFIAPCGTRDGDTIRASLAALFAAMTRTERRQVLGGDF